MSHSRLKKPLRFGTDEAERLKHIVSKGSLRRAFFMEGREMKITFTKPYTKYAVGDSDDFSTVEGGALVALGLAEEVKEEAPAPKKGKEQVTE